MVNATDEECEQMASSFLEGNLSDEAFLKEFKEKRKLYHSRNAKLEYLERSR